MNDYIIKTNTNFNHTFLFAYYNSTNEQNEVLRWILIASLIIEAFFISVKFLILLFYFLLYKQGKFICKECHCSIECDCCFAIEKYCKYLYSIIKRFYKYNFYCYTNKFHGVFSTIAFILFETLIVYNTIQSIHFKEQNAVAVYISSIIYIIMSVYLPLYYFTRKKIMYLVMLIVIILGILSHSLVSFLNPNNVVYSIIYHMISFIISFIAYIRVMLYDKKNEAIKTILNAEAKKLYYQVDISQEKLKEISSTSDIKDYYSDSKSEHYFEMRDRYHYKLFLIILFIVLCLSKGFILFSSFNELFKSLNKNDTILEIGLLIDLLSLNALAWITFTKIEITTIYIE